MAWMRQSRPAVKTIAERPRTRCTRSSTTRAKRGWTNANPCKLVDKPRRAEADADVRFLEQNEIDALLARGARRRARGVGASRCTSTAVMTGMRQGELLALRWRGRRLGGAAGPRAPQLRPRRVRHAEVQALDAVVPLADRAGRRVATPTVQRDGVRGRRGPRVRAPAHRQAGRPLPPAQALQGGAAARAVSRPVRFHDLRHTFGTRWRPPASPMRTLQEWMGHRDFKTTLIYADYMPGAQEADLVERAFALGTNLGTNLSTTGVNSDPQKPL